MQLTSHVRLVQDVLLGSGEQKLDVLEVAEGLRRLGHSVVIRTALGGGGGGECLRNLRHTFLTCTVSGEEAARLALCSSCSTLQANGLHLDICLACEQAVSSPCALHWSSVRDQQVSRGGAGVPTCLSHHHGPSCHLCYTGTTCATRRHLESSAGTPAAAQHPVSYIVDPAFREQFEIPHVSTRYAAILAHLPRVFIGTEERVGPLVELLCSEIGAAFKLAGATLPPWRASPAMLSKWRPRKSTDCVLGDADSARQGQAPLLLDAAPLQSRAASMPVPQNFPAPLSLTAGAGRRPSMPVGLVGRRNSDSKPHLSPAVQLTVHRAGSLGDILDVEQAAPRMRLAQSQLSSLSPAYMAAQAARHMLHVL